MNRKDIQICKFIVACVCGIVIMILLGSIGNNEREVISNRECLKTGFTGLFLLGTGLFTNYLLNREMKKDEWKHRARNAAGIEVRFMGRKNTNRNHARRSYR